MFATTGSVLWIWLDKKEKSLKTVLQQIRVRKGFFMNNISDFEMDAVF